MDSAKRFLASLERLSPSPYGNHAHPAVNNRSDRNDSTRTLARPFQTPLHRPSFAVEQRPSSPFLEQDLNIPLDAFDKELLAEASQEQPQAAQGAARVSLPSRTAVRPNRASVNPAIRDALQHTPMVSSSSSPLGPVSSPSVSMLQNRRSNLPNPTKDFRLLHTNAQYDAPQRNKGYMSIPGTENTDQSLMPLRHAPPKIQGIQLIPTAQLPDQLASIFSFELFNAIQSRCFWLAYNTDDNLVLSAPTGSGKTAVMELAICRLVTTYKGNNFKIVYQAPTKSLCAERYRDWQAKFGILDLRCAELTGDTAYGHMGDVQKASIIITTPEKWDSVTRKWKDHQRLMELIKLFLVDEVHILKESRGATLEAVVSRMKSFGAQVRFVALSATVPNSEDIAAWLGRNGSLPEVPAHREVFGESFRPVKLEKHVYGLEGSSNDWGFDTKLMEHVPESIVRHGKGKPTMVFCCTRQSAVKTASLLAETWKCAVGSMKPWKAPSKPIAVDDAKLKETGLTGVAFHHGGLSLPNRQAVEQGFLQGDIKIICSTSTLAVGVNLPCFLVVLQGTLCYGDNGMQEYSDLEVMQMLGRAGRPQFETSACAVILARQSKVTRYEKMVSGEEVLESCLHQNLIEHLNAEISLGTIYDLASAERWLGSSFLRVRLRRNPDHYRFNEDVDSSNGDELIQKLCEKDLKMLLDASLIEDQGHLRCSDFGDAMARYCVRFESMKRIIRLPPKAKISEILWVLAQGAEFSEARMKAVEKSFYKELNHANDIKYPIKVDVALQAHKVSLIIQAELGSVPLPDRDQHKKFHHQYQMDKAVVFGHANRLIRCIVDCQLQLQDSVSTQNALELGRSIGAKVWDNTASQLRQLPGVGEVAVRKLAAARISSVDNLLNSEPHRIELVLGKAPPFGNDLLKKISSFPNLRVSIREMGRELKHGTGATIQVKIEVGFLNDIAPIFFGKTPVYVCVLTETSDGKIVDFRRFGGGRLQNGEEIFLLVQLVKPTLYIRCSVMCDAIAGTSKYAEIDLKTITPSIYPATQRELVEDVAKKFICATLSQRNQVDNFDDASVDDGELLAALAHESDVEFVQDIDELLAEEDANNLRRKSQKRKASVLEPQSEDEDDELREFREPVQLQNGRWACQHDCNDKGIVCRHKCCREGVPKPKRRLKQVKQQERYPKQRKLTAMTTVSKKNTQMATSEVKRLNTLHSSVFRAALKTDRPAGKDVDCEKRFEQQKAPKEIAVESLEDILSSLSKGSVKNSLTMVDCDLERSVVLVDTDPTEQGHQWIDNPEHNEDNAGDELFGAEDCDWTNSNTETTPDPLKSVSRTKLRQVDKLETVESVNLGDLEDNFRGSEPPIPHVNMADIHNPSGREGFITSLSINPIKAAVSSLPTAEQEEDFCGTPFDPIDFDSDVLVDTHAEFRYAMGKEVDHPDDLPIEAIAISTSTDNPFAQDTRNCVSKTGERELQTAKEEAKRLYEEDQKKKWEGLEPWMFEAFHDFVELV